MILLGVASKESLEKLIAEHREAMLGQNHFPENNGTSWHTDVTKNIMTVT